mgnify:CR=1 FL=1
MSENTVEIADQSAAVTPDSLRKGAAVLVKLARGASLLAPPAVKAVLLQAAAVLEVASGQEWLVELLVFALNRVASGQGFTKEEFLVRVASAKF